MDRNEALFEQMAAFIVSVHQVHYELTKDMPLPGITPLQYEILEFLTVYPTSTTLSRLSECKGLSLPNASREVKKLTELGLCAKVGDPKDRRVHYIRLSPLGEQYMGEAFDHMKKAFFRRVEGLDEEERARAEEAMALLVRTVLRPSGDLGADK